MGETIARAGDVRQNGCLPTGSAVDCLAVDRSRALRRPETWSELLAKLERRPARREDVGRSAARRRALLDGLPGADSLRAVEEVLDGHRAGSVTDAGAGRSAAASDDDVTDDLGDGEVAAFAAAQRLAGYLLWQQLCLVARLLGRRSGRTPTLPRRARSARSVRRSGGTPPLAATVGSGSTVDGGGPPGGEAGGEAGGRAADEWPDPALDDGDLVEDEVVTELALEAGLTVGRVVSLLGAAKALVVDGRLPATAAMLRDGLLDWSRVQALVSRTADLSVAGARAVEADVLAQRDLLRAGLTRFTRAVDRAVMAVDAAAAEARRRRCRRDRRVGLQTLPDGNAFFTVTGPAEALVAAYQGLDAAAREVRRSDGRTLEQLRFDLLVSACTRGLLPVPDGSLPPVPGVGATEADSDREVDPTVLLPADAGDGDATWFTTTWPDVQPQVRVTVSLETLLGLSEAAGELDGYGPIGAALARDLAANGVWRCLAVDDRHGTVLGVGRSTFTAGYTPGRNLRLFVDHAAPTCSVPWCGVAARRCDLDHRRPWQRGGATCSCNVHPLCRRHHRLKTAGLLVARPSRDPSDPPGTTVFVLRTERSVVARPHVPLPRSGLADARAGSSTDEDDPPF